MINSITQITTIGDSDWAKASDVLLAKVMDDYLAALQSGTPIDVESIVEEHPQLADDIRLFAESLDMLHGSTKKIRSGNVGVGAEGVSKCLGDFEIGRELGRGGMGVVYEARQISLERQVALKVLPFAAMWDQKQIARFRNESQAAAQLHHPNIVPVFAVGQERGVHFYAMQLIDGQSLDVVIRQLRREAEENAPTCHGPQLAASTQHISTTQHGPQPESALSSEYTSDRMEYIRSIARLGVQAAEALHHAHECGVLHRDIKPSNLLVDHRGKLWITDFGLARMQNGSGVTLTGDVVGTLRYMSPEQAAGQHALVDQRTDVYALGATLHELLTLKPAFPGEDRQQILRAIEQQEPLPPRRILPKIPVDLETIVLSSMAKSREDRYASAQLMADDLNRFLAGKPTLARRPTVVDHAAKWLRRHRAVAAAAALVLVAVASISTVGALMLAQETREKEAALVKAEQNLQQARLVVDRFGSTFSRQLERLPGSEPLRRALLQDTLSYYHQFISGAEGDPTLQNSLATTNVQAAAIASRLGRRAEAKQLYETALALFEKLANATGEDKQFQAQQAACLNNLALILASLGDSKAALDRYENAIELQSGVVASDDAAAGPVSSLAEMHTNLGLLRRRCGDLPGARQSLQQAIRLLEDLAQQYPDELRHAHGLAIAFNNRSFVEQATNWSQADDSCQAAIDVLERLLTQPTDAQSISPGEKLALRSDLALCYNNRGAIKSHLADAEKACASYRSAIDIQRQLSRQAPAVVRYRSDLSVSWNNLGQALSLQEDSAGSEEAFEKSEAILAELVEDHPEEVRFRSCLAGVLNNQAMALEQAGLNELALTKYEAAIRHQCFATEQAPQEVQYREFLSKHYFNCGRVLRAVGRPAEAAQTALKRRVLWPTHGERLFHVAQELAQAAELLAEQQTESSDTVLHDQIANEVFVTLRQAKSAGYRPAGERLNQVAFRRLEHMPEFQELLTGEQ